jgi:hypothetical protein
VTLAGRRILGNLLCEDDFRRLLRPGRRFTPPREVLETVSGAATLLRVFAREGDRLWTPAPVDPGRLAEVPGLPRPVLESGPVENLPAVSGTLTWGASLEVSPPGPVRAGSALHDLLWTVPLASPRVAATVNHRAFALRVAKEIGCALPGARMVESVSDLRAVARGSWVLKAPLSAAGRDRHIERGGKGLEAPATLRRVENLFARHGPLLLEPWMDRTDDFGVAVLILPEETRLLGCHRLLVDRKGQFTGIELDLEDGPDRDRLEETALTVARLLRQAGYLGPFGIDGWRYRTPDGSVVLNPLGEINARMTFGLVARVLADRIGLPSGTRLLFGKEIPAKDGVVPLLLPGREGGGAWLAQPAPKIPKISLPYF